jgi:hypothetical protein
MLLLSLNARGTTYTEPACFEPLLKSPFHESHEH